MCYSSHVERVDFRGHLSRVTSTMSYIDLTGATRLIQQVFTDGVILPAFATWVLILTV